jgi:tellurite resistance protein TerC
LVEKSLSVDNIFVIFMIFSYFSIPEEYQHRVLFYGIWGAVIMRLILILLGTWMVEYVHWILYILGAFLVLTGFKMMFQNQEKSNLSKSWILRFMSKYLRLIQLQGEKFFIKKNGVKYFTPLFLALIYIEISDLIFAADSIPAIFSITLDSFIVFTSNILALLGLRHLYFLLIHLHNRFYFFKYGIAIVLMFIGVEMIVSYWFDIPRKIIFIALILVLLLSLALSLLKGKQKA